MVVGLLFHRFKAAFLRSLLILKRNAWEKWVRDEVQRGLVQVDSWRLEVEGSRHEDVLAHRRRVGNCPIEWTLYSHSLWALRLVFEIEVEYFN